MRFKRTLTILCIMLMAALFFGPDAWADFGMAPAWSPDMGVPPILPPWSASNLVDMKGVSQVTKEIITAPIPSTSVSVDLGDASPVPWSDNLPVVTMPLVYGPDSYGAYDTTQSPSVGSAPILPSIALVETPHDRSVKAIEVPNGGIVLQDGTVVTCGTGMGSGDIGPIDPPPALPLPENWDSIGMPTFQAPVLSGP